MKKNIYLAIICILAICNASGQTLLKGLIVDNDTKEALAFAHILIKGSHSGVMSDIDGLFEIQMPKGKTDIICSYIGYESQDISILASQKELTIKLKIDENKLETLDLVAQENPAYAIIRKVIKRKSVNDPENNKTFKYRCYNKVTYDLVYQNTLKGDTARIEANKILQGGHMMMSESVTERKFLYPDYSEENIEATRFSGFKNPIFTSLATDIQPFSFYQELIPFLDIQYLNPISNGGLSKYDFYIRDTYINTSDSTYVIEFYPRKNKNIEALKGFLFINSKSFAIENVTAEPFEKGKMNLKIEQKYALQSNGKWFPEQLNYVLSADKYPSPESGLEIVGKSYITEVQFDLDYKPKTFSVDQVKIEDGAFKKDTTFWNNYRSKELTKKELTTYVVIDSLGKEYKADKMMSMMEGLTRGTVSLKNVEVDLNNSIKFNDFEGFRLGLGLYSSDSISKVFRLGGYYGFGFKDKIHKYGSSIELKLSKDKEAFIKLDYSNDLEEFGKFGRPSLERSAFSQRELIAFNMNKVKKISLNTSLRTLKYFKTEWSINSADYTPLFEYTFENSKIKNRKETWFAASVRWCYKEKFIQTMNQSLSLGSDYPVFTFHYNKGLQNVFNGSTSFDRFELNMNYSHYFKNFGKSSLKISGGIIQGNVPEYLLFSGFGGLHEELKIITPGTFQTMDPYEFVSNQYLNVFYTHNFGTLLFNRPEFKPQFSLAHNMGWSKPTDLSNHNFETSKKDYSKGYFESGLIVDNILRVNYFNIGYLGIGAGFFANYGFYSEPEFKNNMVYKLSAVFTTK